jgi:hypothetical protein
VLTSFPICIQLESLLLLPLSLPPSISPLLFLKGVTAIDTNVPEKKVVVQTEDHVQATDLLTALAKWGEAAGKEVKMLA